MTSSNYLVHHGIKGQKWGVRRTPEELGHVTYSVKKESRSETASKLNDELSKWEYGYKVNGKKLGEDSGYYDQDFSKWKTRPVEQLEKDKIGNCWDFVNYQHYKLDKAGIPNQTYMMYIDKDGNPDNAITHTFTIFQDENGKSKWLEQSAYPVAGIHDVKGPEDVYSTMINKIYKSDSKSNCYIWQYDPTGMDKGLSSDEYAEKAMSGDPIIEKRYHQ